MAPLVPIRANLVLVVGIPLSMVSLLPVLVASLPLVFNVMALPGAFVGRCPADVQQRADSRKA